MIHVMRHFDWRENSSGTVKAMCGLDEASLKLTWRLPWIKAFVRHAGPHSSRVSKWRPKPGITFCTQSHSKAVRVFSWFH